MERGWGLACLSHTNLFVSRVTAVGPDEISITDKKTKDMEKHPYGICVWSTGVAPLPITKTIMERVPAQGRGSVDDSCKGWIMLWVHVHEM